MAKVTLEDRARSYLTKVPGAVAGSGGHNATFRAACVLVIDFALDRHLAAKLLGEWNSKCIPPWSQKELDHKLDQAEKQAEKDTSRLGAKARPSDAHDRKSASKNGKKRSASGQSSASSFALEPQNSRDIGLISGEKEASSCVFSPTSHAISGNSGGFGGGIASEQVVDEALFGGFDEESEEIEAPKEVESSEKSIESEADGDANACEFEENTPEVGENGPEECSEIETVFGSKAELWRIIKAAKRLAGGVSRNAKGGLNARANVLLIDSNVCAELPSVIDGMAVRPWDGEGYVEVCYCRSIVVEGDTWRYVASAETGQLGGAKG